MNNHTGCRIKTMDAVQFKFVVPLLLLFLVVPWTLATDFKYCDKNADYDVKVSGVEIIPNPVARGKPATFSTSASTGGMLMFDTPPRNYTVVAAAVGKEISGGKLVIDVSYFGWHIHSETHDLCGETSCPVSIGEFVFSHSQELPGYTPPGPYSLTMKMYDTSKKELTCINFDFDIGFASSSADS